MYALCVTNNNQNVKNLHFLVPANVGKKKKATEFCHLHCVLFKTIADFVASAKCADRVQAQFIFSPTY